MRFKLTKEENLNRIYCAYTKDVYRACLYLTKDEGLAQEMVQQTFLNFYETEVEVKPECERAYLIRTARNLTYNYFRRTKFEVYQKGDDETFLMERATESLEDEYFERDLRESKQELSEEILEAVKEHNEEWYDILYSIFYLEKSHDDIAEELGLTKDVLYSRLYRAKHWIRKNYEKKFHEVENGPKCMKKGA